MAQITLIYNPNFKVCMDQVKSIHKLFLILKWPQNNLYPFHGSGVTQTKKKHQV